MYDHITARDQQTRQELGEFLAALFAPHDLIELRLIETWQRCGQRESHCVGRQWLTSDALHSAWPALRSQNRSGANVFFGVNPRKRQGSKKADVAFCRTLWADLDNVRPQEESRWAAFPPPSVIVDSGHGVHLYWRLSQPVMLSTSASRTLVEAVLRGMYQTLESDPVQDVSRLLRLPGFANVKDLRNGRVAMPCRLVAHHENRRYHFTDFQHYAVEPPSRGTSEVREARPSGLETVSFLGLRDTKRIRGLVRLLANEAADRSKRDFFVVTKLLTLGCTPAEIAELVSPHSKFSGNEIYLKRTIDNALRAAGRGE